MPGVPEDLHAVLAEGGAGVAGAAEEAAGPAGGMSRTEFVVTLVRAALSGAVTFVAVMMLGGPPWACAGFGLLAGVAVTERASS